MFPCATLTWTFRSETMLPQSHCPFFGQHKLFEIGYVCFVHAISSVRRSTQRNVHWWFSNKKPTDSKNDIWMTIQYRTIPHKYDANTGVDRERLHDQTKYLHTESRLKQKSTSWQVVVLTKLLIMMGVLEQIGKGSMTKFRDQIMTEKLVETPNDILTICGLRIVPGNPK